MKIRLAALALLFSSSAFAAAPATSGLVLSATGVWTLTFTRDGATYRESNNAIAYTSTLKDAAGNTVRTETYTNSREVEKNAGQVAASGLVEMGANGGKVAISLPRWDMQAGAQVLADIPASEKMANVASRNMMVINGDLLTAANADLKDPGEGIKVSIAIATSTCSFSADQVQLTCVMPVTLTARCSNFVNCHF